MQRCFTYAVALAATGGLDLASTSAAWAQGIQCPGPAIIKPFDGDANSVRGIAGATQLTVQACARGYLSVIAGSYVEQINPKFAPSGMGFTSGVKVFPCGGTGRGSDLPGTRLEVGFFSADRLNLMAEAGAAFTLAADDEAPKIKITPPSGTKVTAGQRMTISVAASERYEDGNKNWQTGVKSIRVEDLTRHEGLPPWDNENARPQSCASKT